MNAFTESLGADIGPLAAGLAEGRERRAKLAAAMADEKANLASAKARADAGLPEVENDPQSIATNFTAADWK
jgi:hypothetical protein